MRALSPAPTPTTRRAALLVAAALATSLAACGSDDGDAADDGEPVVEETDDGTADDGGTDDDGMTDDGDADDGVTDDGDTDDGDADGTAADDGDTDGSLFSTRTGSLELQEVLDLGNGIQIAVTGVTVEPMAVFVDIEALNGHTDDVTFGTGNIRFEDNTGREYPYVLPEENQDLRIPAGGTMQATLAFQGALNPDATRADLVLNRGYSTNTRPEALWRDLELPQADA